MKYEIIDRVSRYVKRFGMVMDPETMNKARDEAGEYDFREISKTEESGHYAVRHGKKMYVIIERDGEIGCSCDDMSYNRMDGSACKHVIAFTRLMSPVTKKIDEEDAAYLMNACGWTGAELHPEIELGGPGAVVQEDTTPTPKGRIPPDPDLDLGVDDPLREDKDSWAPDEDEPLPEPPNEDFSNCKNVPEPTKPQLPPEYTRICRYCKMGATREGEAVADAWLKEHEAGCVKNPANDPEKINDALIESEQKPEEETKMEDKPAWNQEAWDNATQGSFVSYNESGIATVLFTSNDFDIGEKPDKWGRTPFEFSVIQHKKQVILSVGAIGLMHALKKILPLEGKMIKIIRTGEGTGTKYEVQEVI